MEVKAGYKQTEVGVIPEDWDIKPLGEVLKVKHGKSQKEVEDRGGKYPILGTGGLMGYTNHFLYDKPSVLIGRKGTIDKPRFMDTPFWTVDTLFYTEIFKNFSPKYLYFKFLQVDWYSYNEASGVPSLNAKTIEKIELVFPSTFEEQTAIATTLSDIDALINNLEILIAKKRNIKHGAMQKLLQPKEGWEIKTLGECLLKNPDYGINAASVEYDDTIPTYLRITDISEDGKYLSSNKVSVNNINSNSYYLEEGDIVIARTGASVGKTYHYNKSDGKLVFAGFLIRVKTNPEILNYKYLFFITQTKLYWSWVLANSMRSGQPGLNSNEIKSFQISIPSVAEQIHIATILSDMDAEITALEIKLDKYKNMKLGMMQTLLTGKIRLV